MNPCGPALNSRVPSAPNTVRPAPGTQAGDVVPENYGMWTLVLDRGRFAVTQEDSQACTWGYGTFTIKGNRIEWLFANGGGIAPDNAINKPGEFSSSAGACTAAC
jgi:hypothetical protein